MTTRPPRIFPPAPSRGSRSCVLSPRGPRGMTSRTALHVVRRYETLPGPIIHKVDYDNNNPSFPILSTGQRMAYTEYNPGAIGRTNPDVGGYTNLLLFEQHLVPSDFATMREDQRIYELNPSNVVTTYDYDSAMDTFIENRRQKCPAAIPHALDIMSRVSRETGRLVSHDQDPEQADGASRSPGGIQDGQQLALPDPTDRDHDAAGGARGEQVGGRLVSQYPSSDPECPRDPEGHDDLLHVAPAGRDDLCPAHKEHHLPRNLFRALDLQRAQ